MVLLCKKKMCKINWSTNLLETCKPSNLSTSFTTFCTNVFARKDVEMKSLRSIRDSWRRVNPSLIRRWIYKSSFTANASKRQHFLPCLREDRVTLLIRWVHSSCKTPQIMIQVVVMMSSIWLKKKHAIITSRKWSKVWIK